MGLLPFDSRMNIGLMIYGSLDQQTGGYLYDRMLAAGLRERGDRVEVFSLPKKTYAGNLLDNLSANAESIVDGSFDVLLQDELIHPSRYLSNRGNRLDLPIVTIVHHLRCSEPHPTPWRSFYGRVEKAYLRGIDGAIFNSSATQAAVDDLTGHRLPSIVAHPGRDHLSGDLDGDAIERRAKQAGPLRVVFLGNLIPRKGLHVLIEALGDMPLDRWRLTVIGSMEFDRVYSANVRRMSRNLIGNIEFLGPLPHSQLGDVLRSSHVVAMPSAYEGFGIAFLDGMGFGLPAIASTAGGASDLVREGGNGFLVPANDVEALTDRLNRLAGDRSTLARMGRRALTDYWRHPTWDDTAGAVRRFLVDRIGVPEMTKTAVRASP